jgi:hypothetical protein
MRTLSVRLCSIGALLSISVVVAACSSDAAHRRIALDHDTAPSRGSIDHGSIVLPTPPLLHHQVAGPMAYRAAPPWYVDRKSYGPEAYGGHQTTTFEDIVTIQRDRLTGHGRHMRDHAHHSTHRYRRVQNVR